MGASSTGSTATSSPLSRYAQEVREGVFPGEEHSF